jgi:CheY-like chemotaxis protein
MAVRILIIEDDLSIQRFMDMALSGEGYEVAIAANGADALAKLSSFHPHIIFMDLFMPRMNGQEFLDNYYTIPGSKAPVIILSASNNIDKLADSIRADGFLPKPFSLNSLLAIVEQHTAGAG